MASNARTARNKTAAAQAEPAQTPPAAETTAAPVETVTEAAAPATPTPTGEAPATAVVDPAPALPSAETLQTMASLSQAAPSAELADETAQQVAADLAAAFDELSPPQRDSLGKVMGEVLAERLRQITVEGFDPERDDRYTDYQLSRAASCYAMHASALPRHKATLYWPWPANTFKPRTRREDLTRAAALILAELERMDRQEAAQ